MDQPIHQSKLVKWDNLPIDWETLNALGYYELAADRPSVRVREDGRVSFRPSEIGKCVRGLVACLLNEKPLPFDEQSLRVMGEGHVHEPVAVKEWERDSGGKVQRHIQLRMNFGQNMVIEGCCDGVWFVDGDEIDSGLFIKVGDGEECDKNIIYVKQFPDDQQPLVYGIEIKASDDNQFDVMSKDGPSETYKWQISVYWYMIEHCMGVTLTGMIFIIRRRRDGMPSRTWIEKPYHSIEEIERRMSRVVELAEKGLDSADCDRSDFFCNWWHIHKLLPGETKKRAEWDPKLAELALEYHRCGVEKDKCEIRADEIKDALNQALVGRDKVCTYGFNLSYSARTGFDEQRCLAENPWILETPDLIKLSLDMDALKKSDKWPEMMAKYEYKGRRYLTIKPIKKELAPGDTKEPKKAKFDPVFDISTMSTGDIERLFTDGN